MSSEGMTMNEPSILKQSVSLTGKLVGVFTLWIALLSVVVVTVTGRAVQALSGTSNDKGATAEPDASGGSKHGSQPAANTSKPNGRI
jgi:hypothetical protein